MRLILSAMLFALAACVGANAQTPAAPDIYVMRHLNTPAGERDPDLLPAGRETATLLATWFGERPAPRAIFVSNYRRTRQTAGPLAERLGLTPIVYDPSDTPALVARVRATPGPVLIVGHSNTVPDIVAQLGGTRPAPLVHEDFGDLWRIGPNGATERLRIAPR